MDNSKVGNSMSFPKNLGMFTHSPSAKDVKFRWGHQRQIIPHFNHYNKPFDLRLGKTSFKFADVKETRFLADVLIWTQRRQLRGLVNMEKKIWNFFEPPNL